MLSCLSHLRLFATQWRTVACQAPLFMEFSSQEYWSGQPFPSPGDLPNPGIKPRSPTPQADSSPVKLEVLRQGWLWTWYNEDIGADTDKNSEQLKSSMTGPGWHRQPPQTPGPRFPGLTLQRLNWVIASKGMQFLLNTHPTTSVPLSPPGPQR